MVDLLQQCIDNLSQSALSIKQDGEISEIEIQLRNTPGSIRKILVDPKRYLIIIYSSDRNSRAQTDEEKQLAYKFIAKANELINFGIVEMNPDTGEFRYRSSLALPGVSNAQMQIQYMLESHDFLFACLLKGIDRLKQRNDEPDNIAGQVFRTFPNKS